MPEPGGDVPVGAPLVPERRDGLRLAHHLSEPADRLPVASLSVGRDALPVADDLPLADQLPFAADRLPVAPLSVAADVSVDPLPVPGPVPIAGYLPEREDVSIAWRMPIDPVRRPGIR